MNNNEELLQELQALRDENDSLKNQLSIADFSNNSDMLTSEKNFSLLAGEEEIPKKYKVFEYMLSPSSQWMYVDGKEDEEYYVEFGMQSYDTFVMEHPEYGFKESDRKAVEFLLRRRINKSYKGFERTMINTQIQEVNYQTKPLLPESSTKKESIFAKFNPFKR